MDWESRKTTKSPKTQEELKRPGNTDISLYGCYMSIMLLLIWTKSNASSTSKDKFQSQKNRQIALVLAQLSQFHYWWNNCLIKQLDYTKNHCNIQLLDFKNERKERQSYQQILHPNMELILHFQANSRKTKATQMKTKAELQSQTPNKQFSTQSKPKLFM